MADRVTVKEIVGWALLYAALGSAIWLVYSR
jgi:hypothetical protein